MTWKKNPGCDLPTIKMPPAIQDILEDIATEAALQQVALLASPEGVYAQRKIAQAAKIVAMGEKQVERAQRYTDILEDYADLLDTCPCADVWDTEATEVDQS